jgi:GNAT superfamily N-acetyltransferase
VQPLRPQLHAELRIDVMLPLVDGELEALYERLYQPGNKLCGLERRPLHDPQFVLHGARPTANGLPMWKMWPTPAWPATPCSTAWWRWTGAPTAACSPHSRLAPAYQRRGIASAVYQQVLDQGVCLLSGAPVAGAHGSGTGWRAATTAITWRLPVTNRCSTWAGVCPTVRCWTSVPPAACCWARGGSWRPCTAVQMDCA